MGTDLQQQIREPAVTDMLRDGPWILDSWTPAQAAAASGRLDMLELLSDHGVPMDDSVMEAAVRGKQLQAIRWLVDRGCPLTRDILRRGVLTDSTAVVRLLADLGAPIDLRDLQYEYTACRFG